jgi:CBS domain-containing protein
VLRGRRLVGLVTGGDLRAAPPGEEPAARDAPVSAVMVRELVTVAPESGLARAARLMLERKLGCLPVCDDGGVLVGMLTEADFVRFAADVVRDLDLMADAVRAGDRPACVS